MLHKKICAFALLAMCAIYMRGLSRNLPTQNPFDGAEWISVDSGSLPVYPDNLTVYRTGSNLDIP